MKDAERAESNLNTFLHVVTLCTTGCALLDDQEVLAYTEGLWI